MVDGAFCRATCCTTTCCSCEVPPDSQATCLQQQQWGKCGEGWMVGGGFCAITCGRCPAPSPPSPSYSPGMKSNFLARASCTVGLASAAVAASSSPTKRAPTACT